jgi:hypothetical protein
VLDRLGSGKAASFSRGRLSATAGFFVGGACCLTQHTSIHESCNVDQQLSAAGVWLHAMQGCVLRCVYQQPLVG